MVAFKVESKYRKVIEILRLVLTGLTLLEFIDGRNWISWAILLTTPLHICTYPTQLKERMQGVVLGLFCPLVLLSASYEPFFFIILAVHLSCWPRSNAFPIQRYRDTKRLLTMEELLTAAIFVSFFFSTQSCIIALKVLNGYCHPCTS